MVFNVTQKMVEFVNEFSEVLFYLHRIIYSSFSASVPSLNLEEINLKTILGKVYNVTLT